MFFPPLDSTVVVDVPSNAQAGGLSLLFRARTGSASALEQLKRDGVKVQAWTNAPVDDDHAKGEWAGYEFEEAPAAPPAQLDHSIVLFPLPPPTKDNVIDEPHTLFLTLRLRPLPRHQMETDFLVTYRLLYPNGEIKWLGYPGRDLRCVLKKTDPWLASPAPANQSSGDVYRTFSTITMKEAWGCWAIGPRSVKYYPKGKASDCEAAFLVLVPKRGPSTFSLHQPIILHGAGLKLDSSGVVTCRTSTPTRVYTAISSEIELSFVIPDLGLRWFGVKDGHALITSAAPEQPVSVYAVPLFIDPAVAERPTIVSLDLTSHGLLAEHPRFVAYSPLSNGVLDSDNSGSRQLHMSVGRPGGSCIVSPVYALFANKPSPLGKAPWGIAYVTPHTTLGAKPEQDSESVAEQAAEASKLECDSEMNFLSREIKALRPSLPTLRMVPKLCLNPRRTVEFLIPLLWRTLGLLLRALIMRLFSMIGLPASPLNSYLRQSHPKGESVEAQVRGRVGGSKTASSAIAKVEYAASEKSEGPSEVLSDSATEVASSGGGKKLRPIRVFSIPKGPFSLLTYSDPTMDTDGNEKQKTQSPVLKVLLNGEPMDLKITSLSQGWIIMQTKGDVSGGKVEIHDTAGSTQNGFTH